MDRPGGTVLIESKRGRRRAGNSTSVRLSASHMAAPDDQPSPKPLDYEAPTRQEGLPRPAAIALATICLVIGIPICAIGAGVLTAVSGFDDRDLLRSLGFIAVGGMFCFAGMRLKRRPEGPTNP